MPRKPRVYQPDTNYHLISRFVNKEWFIAGSAERRAYLHFLGEGFEHSDWRCMGYAVMSSHVHLDMISGKTTIASFLRNAHAKFAEWINQRNDRIGAVFVRGPKMQVVETEHFATVLAYIHNNPVRAGVVPEPSATTWTSHRAYLGLERAPSWLHVEEGLERARIARRDLDEWVKSKPSLDLIRDSGQQNELSIDTVTIAVSSELAISTDELFCRGNSQLQSHARKVAVQTASALGFRRSEIACALSITPDCVTALRRSTDPEAIAVSHRIIERLQAGLPVGGAIDTNVRRLPGLQPIQFSTFPFPNRST